MTQPRRVTGLGWRPDSLDHRDHKFMLRPTDVPLPAVVDLRAGFPDAYDQGQLGSCTGNGVAGMMQYARRKAGLPDFTPSRLYVYYYERVIEGTVAQDAGAEIRDGLKVVASRGAPDEALWPYDVNQFAAAPGPEAEAGAVKDLAVAYQGLDNADLGALQNCLAVAANPIVFGCSVFPQFEGVGADGLVTLPGAGDAPIGGHCMVIAGYDDAKAAFLARNSWGTGWGLGGYCWMPYAYLTDPNLADDFWHVELVESLST